MAVKMKDNNITLFDFDSDSDKRLIGEQNQ